MFPKAKVRAQVTGVAPTLGSILNELPSLEACVQLLEIYCLHCENVYRVMHLPTLFSNFLQFERNDTKDNPFIAQFALIVTIASSLWIENVTERISSHVDTQMICLLVDQWLSGFNDKERINLPTLQTQTLLVIAKQAIPSTTPLQLWRATGDLVRSAMILGLHQDPEDPAEPVPPHVATQTRRWLWHTIIELDLLASISCRMPSLVGTFEYTTCLPIDIDDDLLTGSVHVHDSHGFGKISPGKSTSHIEYSKSLPIRVKALTLLTMAYPDTNAIQETLVHLETERVRVTQHPALLRGVEPETLLMAEMLDMHFKRPMISLYMLQLQQLQDMDDARLHDTCRDFIDLAAGVMSTSDMLDPRQTDYDIMKDERYWVAFQAHYGDDLIRAATGACFASRILMSESEALTTISSGVPRAAMGQRFCPRAAWPRNYVRKMVDDIVESLIRLSPDLRGILKQIMALAMAAELTRIQLDVQTQGKYMREALQKVFRLCRERHQLENSTRGSDMPEQLQSGFMPSAEGSTNIYNFGNGDVDNFNFDWVTDLLPGIIL